MKKIKGLREKSTEELLKLKSELQTMMMGTGLKHIHPIIPFNNGYRNAKRAIAQINTLLKERELKK